MQFSHKIYLHTGFQCPFLLRAIQSKNGLSLEDSWKVISNVIRALWSQARQSSLPFNYSRTRLQVFLPVGHSKQVNDPRAFEIGCKIFNVLLDRSELLGSY